VRASALDSLPAHGPSTTSPAVTRDHRVETWGEGEMNEGKRVGEGGRVVDARRGRERKGESERK